MGLPFPARAAVRALAPGACAAGTAAQSGRAPGAVWPDEGPRTRTAPATVPAIMANDLRTRLYQLADDSMRGRPIGEPGSLAGTAHVAREFRRLGLRPAGDSGSYFQVLPSGPAGHDRAASRLASAGDLRRRPGVPALPVTP